MSRPQASIYCPRHSKDQLIPQGAPAVLQLLPTLVLDPSGKGADPEEVSDPTTLRCTTVYRNKFETMHVWEIHQARLHGL